jgi:plasmid maintenance system antidote protein VapI
MDERPDNRLAELMDAQGIAARDLAVRLDVTEDTIKRLRRPSAALPSKYLPTLVDLLGATSDQLLGLDREPVTTEVA